MPVMGYDMSRSQKRTLNIKLEVTGVVKEDAGWKGNLVATLKPNIILINLFFNYLRK